MYPQKRAYIFAFSAIVCWSTIGSAFKITLRYLDPLSLLFYSSFVASGVLLMILIIQKKLYLLRAVNGREILFSAFLGLLNPFFYYVVLLKAYDLLPAQVAGTLNYIWPLMLVLLSIPLLKQKISPWSVVAILISFFGIIVISTHGQFSSLHFSHPLGIALALFSAVFWALYWIFNIKDQREAVSKLFLNFCFGFFYTAIAMLTRGEFILPDFAGLAGAVYIGFFEMGITFVLWFNALKFSSTTAKVSNLIYLSPFISLIIIHFIVGETIFFSTVIGLVFIVSGIILQQYLKEQ
ncbi:MAG: DMT family transporter [Bacteroidales bacterium]|jgi:drug/metabolite transporter (DMT)-like permease|nr:DMT family transporter [Bacteroidales bacterium]